MRIIEAANVNEAYLIGYHMFKRDGKVEPSRNGNVLALSAQLCITYKRPWERVLLDEGRDANPAFHLFESLWMLSGRNDATWLDRFISDFSKRFAEPDGLQHGAYGYRWREHFDLEWGGHPHLPDQLSLVVERLQQDPKDRRVVIQMWDPVADLGADKRDVPCNLTAVPRIVEGKLDLTVFCRSGDFIWGSTGANAVHFSFLLEYLAGRIGVSQGRLTHVITNPHVYTGVIEALPPPTSSVLLYPVNTPIGNDWSSWDKDLAAFMAHPGEGRYSNIWFEKVANPMWNAHTMWKKGERHKAYNYLSSSREDWFQAQAAWMKRRIERAKEKADAGG